jgi:hypothetical protein
MKKNGKATAHRCWWCGQRAFIAGPAPGVWICGVLRYVCRTCRRGTTYAGPDGQWRQAAQR